jgi:hypothetical protein
MGLRVRGTLLVALMIVARTMAQEALSARIDRLVDAALTMPTAGPANDDEFLRRVTLDLTGVIPTPEAIRGFRADTDPDKRGRLIDRLLASPEHHRWFATWLDHTFHERRPDKVIPRADWEAWLFEAARTNRPLHHLLADLVESDGVDPARRTAAKFLLDRDADTALVVRDVGRMFFGRDIQCAQCHDHVNVDDYYQEEFHSLAAFFSRTQLFNDEKAKQLQLGEKAEGEVEFHSVFEPATRRVAAPKPPFEGPTPQPAVKPGEEYRVKPADKVRPVPAVSRRALLAARLRAGDNPQLARNLSNRLWAMLFGRGLVHPLDLHHADNPPTHPEVLDLISETLKSSGYNARALLAQLARTRAYQRGGELPSAWTGFDPKAELVAAEKSLAERKAAVRALEAERLPIRKDQRETDRKLAAAIKDRDAKAAPVVELDKARPPLDKAKSDADAALAERLLDLTTLRHAADALTVASRRFPKDVELEKQRQTTVARVGGAEQSRDVAAGVAAGAAAALADWRKRRDAAAAILAQAESVRGGLAARIEANRAKLADVDRRIGAARSDWRLAERRAGSLKLSVEHAERHRSLAQKDQEFRSTETERSRVATQLASAREAAAKLEANRASLMAERARLVADQPALAAAVKAEAARLAGLDDVVAAVARVPGGAADPALVKVSTLLGESRVTLAAGEKSAAARATALVARLAAIDAELPKALAAIKEQAAAAEQLTAALAALDPKLAKARADRDAAFLATSTSRDALALDQTERLAVAALKPLRAEQIGWSVWQATGVKRGYEAQARAELTKAKQPVTAESVEAYLHKHLRPAIGEFPTLFGAPAGQVQDSFHASVDQALFVRNGGSIQAWLGTGGDAPLAKAGAAPDPDRAAEEIYLAFLGRAPDPEERKALADAWTRRAPDRPKLLRELAWGLLASAEFRFNR